MSDLAVPLGARLIHVGPSKTGTTTIQLAMHHSRAELAAHGVHYPGTGHRPKAATIDVRRPPGDRTGDWDELVAEVRSSTADRVCISSESLSVLGADGAAEVVRSLGDEAVHVVMAVRPIDALLPSMWQQRVRRFVGIPAYDDWLRAVLLGGPDDPSAAAFWSIHDLERQIRDWSAAAGPERVTVIVIEEGDHAVLPNTFEDLLDLPRGTLAPKTRARNQSLDRASTELLLQLDRAARERGWTEGTYVRTIRNPVIDYLRKQPRDATSTRPLPSWAAEQVYEINTARADLLAATPVRVVGDPDSLRPHRRVIAVEEAPPDPKITAEIAAGVAAIAADQVRERHEVELGRKQDRIAKLERQLARAEAAPSTPELPPRRIAVRVRSMLTRR